MVDTRHFVEVKRTAPLQNAAVFGRLPRQVARACAHIVVERDARLLRCKLARVERGRVAALCLALVDGDRSREEVMIEVGNVLARLVGVRITWRRRGWRRRVANHRTN